MAQSPFFGDTIPSPCLILHATIPHLPNPVSLPREKSSLHSFFPLPLCSLTSGLITVSQTHFTPFQGAPGYMLPTPRTLPVHPLSKV